MPQTESEKRTLEEDAWPSPPLARSKPTRSHETSAPCNLAAIEAAAATLSEPREPMDPHAELLRMDPLAALLRERPPQHRRGVDEQRGRTRCCG